MNGMDMGTAMPHAASGRPLTIGLVNNMPAGARRSTERQFRTLVAAAVGNQAVRLRCFCAEPPGRSGEYSDIEAIFDTDLDAIIVTGAEPQSESLRDEPLWPRIVRLVDWADARGIAAIWSCLAAHAAVLYLDGVDREPFAEKLSGIFAGDNVAPEHPLMRGVTTSWSVPHSRCNDLPEEGLRATGYSVLVRSDEAGVGVFYKRMNAPFLFLQCHPEYDADTLLREFQRDIRRYQRGERRSFPAAPRNCLQPEAGAIVQQLGAGAMPIDKHTSADFSLLARAPGSTAWLPTSVKLFRNWIADVARRKEEVRQPAWIVDTPMKPVEMGISL